MEGNHTDINGLRPLPSFSKWLSGDPTEAQALKKELGLTESFLLRKQENKKSENESLADSGSVIYFSDFNKKNSGLKECADQLFRLFYEDIKSQQQKILSLNPSRKKKLIERILGITLKDTKVSTNEALQSVIDSPPTPRIQQNYEQYLNEVTIVSLLRVMIVAQWIELSKNDKNKKFNPEDIYNSSWIFSRELTRKPGSPQKGLWQYSLQSLYSWYNPPKQLVDKFCDLIAALKENFKNPALLEHFTDNLLQNSLIDIEGFHFPPENSAKSRLCWEILDSMGQSFPIREVGKSKISKLYLAIGRGLLPVVSMGFSRLDRYNENFPSEDCTDILQNGFHWLGPEGLESFLIESILLWRNSAYQFAIHSEVKPNDIDSRVFIGDISQLHENTQLDMLHTGSDNQVSPQSLKILKDCSRFDVVSAFFFGKDFREKKKLSNSIKTVISKLREGGITLIGSDQNWISNKGFETLRKEILKQSKLIQVIDLSKCKVDCINNLPPYMFVLQKCSSFKELNSCTTKVINVSGQVRNAAELNSLLYSIGRNNNDSGNKGDFIYLPETSERSFKINVFQTDTSRGEITNGGSILLKNPEHCKLLKGLISRSARLGSVSHVFDSQVSEAAKKLKLNNHISLVLCKDQDEPSLKRIEFWPSDLAINTKRKKMIFIETNNHILTQRPFLLALLNSNLNRYWLEMSSSCLNTLGANEIRMIPIITSILDVKPSMSERIIRIRESLGKLDAESASHSIDVVLKEGNKRDLYDFILMLQNQWDHGLVVLNKNSNYFLDNPAFSYDQLNKKTPELNLSILSEKMQKTKEVPFYQHSDLWCNVPVDEINSFQVNDVVLETAPNKQNSAEELHLQRAIVHIKDPSGRTMGIQGPIDILTLLKQKLERNSKGLFISEALETLMIPEDFDFLREQSKQTLKITSRISEQLNAIKLLKNEAIIKLAFDKEDRKKFDTLCEVDLQQH